MAVDSAHRAAVGAASHQAAREPRAGHPRRRAALVRRADRRGDCGSARPVGRGHSRTAGTGLSLSDERRGAPHGRSFDPARHQGHRSAERPGQPRADDSLRKRVGCGADHAAVSCRSRAGRAVARQRKRRGGGSARRGRFTRAVRGAGSRAAHRGSHRRAGRQRNEHHGTRRDHRDRSARF